LASCPKLDTAYMAPISKGDLDVLRARTAQTAGVPLERIP
jgi:hypothetical protein